MFKEKVTIKANGQYSKGFPVAIQTGERKVNIAKKKNKRKKFEVDEH